MAWVLLEDDFPHHPKIIKAGPSAAYLFVCGLCYCRRYHTNGVIPEKAIATLGLTARHVPAMTDALVQHGLWTRSGTKSDQILYTINGYSERYNDANDKIRRKNEKIVGTKLHPDTNRINKRRDRVLIRECVSGDVLSIEEQNVQTNVRTDAFEEFWRLYPKHDGKKLARKEWDKLNPDEATQKLIAEDIARRRRSSQWLKDGGQFIPHARTYLSQERFKDGFKEQPRLSERTVNVMKGFEEPE